MGQLESSRPKGQGAGVTETPSGSEEAELLESEITFSVLDTLQPLLQDDVSSVRDDVQTGPRFGGPGFSEAPRFGAEFGVLEEGAGRDSAPGQGICASLSHSVRIPGGRLSGRDGRGHPFASLEDAAWLDDWP